MKYIVYFMSFVLGAFMCSIVPDGIWPVVFMIGAMTGTVGTLILSHEENK